MSNIKRDAPKKRSEDVIELHICRDCIDNLVESHGEQNSSVVIPSDELSDDERYDLFVYLAHRGYTFSKNVALTDEERSEIQWIRSNPPEASRRH